MYKLFSIFSISSLLQGHAFSQSILAFMSGIPRTFKAVNRRALSTIGTTLMLSALLSACSGGGGGGSDAPAPAAPTTPTFSVSSSNFSIDEDFATPQLVASVSNATAITVSQSNTGVVTVTTSNAQVNVLSMPNANGRTILTIRATNGTLIATTQVTVTVNAVNDPPTLAVSSNNISTVGGFSPITINTTASDIEDGALAFTVSESTPGVVRVGTPGDAIILSNIPNASGQTTLTVTAVDSSGSTVTQTIAVNVTITTSTSIPALFVSSTLVNEQEDFGAAVVIRTTATDADGDAITFSVSPLRGIVNADISTSVISTNTIVNTITLSAVANTNGTATLTVRATDAGGQSTEVNIVVVVVSVNDTPTLTIPNANLVVAEDFSGDSTIATAIDIDGDTLTFSVVESTTGVVTVSTSASGVSISNRPHANGVTTLTITVRDGSLSSTAQVMVTVTEVNDPPILNIPSATLTRVEDFVGGITVATASDVDGNPLTFSVDQSTTGVIRVTTLTSDVRISSRGDANGITTLSISVNDGTVSSTAQVVVTVTEVNDPPVLTVSTAALTLLEDFATPILIGTTRTDIDSTTLTLAVAQSNAGMVIVTTTDAGVRVANIANANGRTTLTITLSDGRLSSTAQVVVDVTPVNDTPTLTVSSSGATVGSDPVVLNVSAFDVEDSTLSFSVSESTVVNTVITTTSLTITRLDFSVNAPQLMLTLRTTDTSGLSTFTIVTVRPSPRFIVTTGIKTLDFAWSAISTATHYQLQSEPTNGSGFTDLSTTGVVVSPNSTNIRQTTAQASVALHRYIPNVTNPQYGVNTCDATSCGVSFVHNTVSLTNAQLNSMIGRLQANNAGAADEFGFSVSLSGDGNTLAVGATNEDSSSTGVNGTQDDNTASDSGAVYVFRRIGGAWSQQAYIKASNTGAGDSFGFRVSLSSDGNTLAVRAASEDGSSAGVNGAQDNTASDSGAVYVFRFSTSTWSQQAYIKASNTGAGDSFGNSVSLSADGNTLAVGATGEDGSSSGVNGAQDDNTASNSGAVYVFHFSTSTWSQQAYIKASNTGAGDSFGNSVSLSADGNTLAVGALLESGSATGVGGVDDDGTSGSGATYVFEFANGAWSQQAYIKASNADVSDRFGQSVSLSANGNTLAVGAILEASSITGVNGAQDDNTASFAGAVYLFRFSTSTWSQQAYIKASNTGSGDFFGNFVSLSADGNTLAVGALFESGPATGVGGVEANGTPGAGATYVFEFANGAWSQQAYIKGTDASIGANFGISVSLSSNGDTLAVGARSVSNSAGVVYLY